jgi:hypothetical protein
MDDETASTSSDPPLAPFYDSDIPDVILSFASHGKAHLPSNGHRSRTRRIGSTSSAPLIPPSDPSTEVGRRRSEMNRRGADVGQQVVIHREKKGSPSPQKEEHKKPPAQKGTFSRLCLIL